MVHVGFLLSVKGYLRKGNILMAMKENDKAADAYQKALDIDPQCSVSARFLHTPAFTHVVHVVTVYMCYVY